MKIRKGDILFRVDQDSIGRDGICSDAVKKYIRQKNLDCSDLDFPQDRCPEFSRCWQKPQRAVLESFRVTSIRRIENETRYYLLNLKNGMKIRVIENAWRNSSDINEYAKSESAAYRIFLKSLKGVIKDIQNETSYFHYRIRNIKSYLSLKKRIEKKIVNLNIEKA